MLTTIGLFAGIGGIEEGLSRIGFEPQLLSEIDSAAADVLRHRFPGVPLNNDIRHLSRIPRVDVLCAGFPCQDLSQAGRTRGIHAGQSSLVKEVFRLASGRGSSPRWILLENVPFMMKLDGGRAMHYITRCLSDLGFTWAYRVVDTRAFGLPQRRKRVLILASKVEDPRPVLLSDDTAESIVDGNPHSACGFYWTEGNTGLGWAVNAVPALKKGSKVSIPSPPAIWLPQSRVLGVPDIRDAERLQGFQPDWTDPEKCGAEFSHRSRWQLVGNAVSVPVAKWVGQRLLKPGAYYQELERRRVKGESWGIAGWGHKETMYVLDMTDRPVNRKYHALADFLMYPAKPLSARAAAGFLCRARASSLHFQTGFLEDVAYHLKRMERSHHRVT